MDPGNRRTQMMVQMPVVIEPEAIEQAECPQVPRPTQNVALGSEMMRILHRRPYEAESEKDEEIVDHGRRPRHDQRSVQNKNPDGFELNPPFVFWIQGILQRR